MHHPSTAVIAPSRMGRRSIVGVALVGAALAGPFVRPVKAAPRTIGWISPENRETMAAFLAAFHKGLAAQARPSTEPVVVIERFASRGPEDIASHVAELQQLGVALIVAQGAATVPVIQAKPKVPVVFGYSGDPVMAGIAQSLAHPGLNATGMSFMSVELNPKRIDLARLILPGCRRLALLSNSRHFGEELEIVACQRAVGALGIGLSVYRVQGAPELTAALAQALDERAEAIIALPSALMVQNAESLATTCRERRVPLISGWSRMAHAGALLTYGPNFQAAYTRVAYYVMQILSGASANSLPIEQPTILELAINLRTAAALNLTLPASLLAQADILIE